MIKSYPPRMKGLPSVSIDVSLFDGKRWVRGYYHFDLCQWYSQEGRIENNYKLRSFYREIKKVTTWRLLEQKEMKVA